MKTRHIFLVIFMAALLIPGHVLPDSMDELSDELSTSFEKLKPPPNSSVDSDYKLDQVALGSLYITKSLHLIYKQNGEMAEKYNILIEKYDRIIDQNEEIIRLLSIIAKQDTGNGSQ